MNYCKFMLCFFIIVICLTNICVSPPTIPPGITQGGGGTRVIQGSLSYSINIDKSEQYRNKTFGIMYKFRNENTNRNIPKVFVFGEFEEQFEVFNVSHPNEMAWNQNNFELNLTLEGGEEKEYIYYLRIKKDVNLDNDQFSIINRSDPTKYKYNRNFKIINNNGINIAYDDSKVRLQLMADNKVDDKIRILNNLPQIKSSSVTIVSDIGSLINTENSNGTLLLKYKNESPSIDLILNITSIDEDDDNLTYIWVINPIGKTFPTYNRSDLKSIQLNSSLETYSFSVYAEDSINNSGVESSKIIYKNIIYKNLAIRNAKTESLLIVILLLCILLIFLFSCIFKYIPESNPYMDRFLDNTNKRRYLILLGPVILYLISIIIAAAMKSWDSELPFYLTSLAWLEIIVYIIVFIFVVLFTHNCFSQHEIKNDKITARLWIVNLIGMTTLIISMTLIIPLIEPTLNIVEHLQWYYSTMAQVFASILAIVAVFYTALPNKNIISINIKEKRIEYNHPMILRRFITIYGVILGLVLLGLSSGVNIEFPTYLEFNPSSLPNIFSIILLETTLLMIPPAISSLYALIRITAFTGTVNIRSRPSAYKIYLDGFDTGLITPAKLMLRDGDYSISFKKNENSTNTNSVNLHVGHGTENEYYFDILKL